MFVPIQARANTTIRRIELLAQKPIGAVHQKR